MKILNRLLKRTSLVTEADNCSIIADILKFSLEHVAKISKTNLKVKYESYIENLLLETEVFYYK